MGITPASEIATSNIPIFNLRNEFEVYLEKFRSNDFREEIFNCALIPVSLPDFSWHGLPNDLLTVMMQRSILGLESYLCAAVEHELRARGKFTQETEEWTRNPFSLDRRITAALFDKLPSLIDPQFSLLLGNKILYDDISSIYKNVRNPLFHGHHITYSGENYARVKAAFEVLALIYDWIDAWNTTFLGAWRNRRINMPNSK